MLFSLYSCKTKGADKKQDRLYFVNSCLSSPIYISKPLFDTSQLVSIGTEGFDDYRAGRFYEYVIKFKNRTSSIDSLETYYWTKDLGIIFSNREEGLCFSRLHSTNDSIERRINDYLDHILSRPNFVMKGEVDFSEVSPSPEFIDLVVKKNKSESDPNK